jgi:hypothetical protein
MLDVHLEAGALLLRVPVDSEPPRGTTKPTRRPPVGQRQVNRSEGRAILMATILWIIAVVLVVAGVFALFRKEMLWGAVLIILGLLVGPGGVSIFT